MHINMKVKTIDITAKEWFDKTFGNSYFSAQIILNYGFKDQEKYCLPFQYGYGDQYIYEAKASLNQINKISTNYNQNLRAYCKENNIILRKNKIDNCKKKEVKEFVK